jgi:hypothetical protein
VPIFPLNAPFCEKGKGGRLRRNYLFAGSDCGGERAAAMYTLIGAAKLNGLDPELYLRTVLAQIAEHPITQIQDLLPWNMAASLQTHSSQAAKDTLIRCPPKNKWTPDNTRLVA